MAWSMEVMCSEKECGGKLLIDEADIRAVDYSSPSKYSAVCAVCGEFISLAPPLLPKRTKEAVDKKKKYYEFD